MADEPENLILQMLRDIRATQDVIVRRLEAIDARLEDVEKRVERSRREVTYAIGMIVNNERIAQEALEQTELVEKRLNEAMVRIEALELR